MIDKPENKKVTLEINNPKGATFVLFSLMDQALVYNECLGVAKVINNDLCRKEDPINRVTIFDNSGELLAEIFI